MNLKYFAILCLLSFQAKSAINKVFNFENISSFQSDTTMGKSTTEGMPEVPTKVILLESDKQSLPNVEIQKVWSHLNESISWYVSNGQKCRCRDEEKKIRAKVDSFEGEHKVEYVGDFRGKHIYRLIIPLVRIREGATNRLVQVEVKASNAKLFSASKKRERKSIIIVLPNDFAEMKGSIKQYYLQKSFSVHFIEDKEVISIREKLRKKIKELYKSNKVTHTLFVGDSSLISPYYLDTRFDSATPSDYPYFKQGDESDHIPDIIGARISIQSPEQLNGYLKKLSIKNADGPIVSIGVSSNEGSNPSDYQYVESILEELSPSTDRYHLNQDNDDSNPTNFVNILNSGVDLFNYIGHGSGFAWPSFRREVKVSDLENWRPGRKGPIVLDVACQNGKFNGRGNIGETMISGHRKYDYENGALAYVGGSVDISWDPPAIFAQGVSKALGRNSSMSIGDGVIEGYLYLFQMHSDLEDIIDHLEWTHIQGDPTASMR